MQIENILAFFSIKSTQLRQFLGELLDYNNPINWNDISENQIFKNNAKCINIIM